MTKFYSAVVENINDPLGADRVKVRVFGLHTDNKSLIPTEALPWAQILKSTDSASISGIGHSAHGLLQGSWVKVYFEDDDNQYPVVIGSISGFSSTTEGSGIEETAFMPIEEVQAKNPPPSPQQVAVGDACEANVDISGFRSKYGNEGPNAVLTACCDSGISNPFAKIAVLANVAKECEFRPRNESFKYSVSRFRQVFPSKTSTMSDSELEVILASEETTANFLYGGKYGNSSTEGYKYRGRGYIQITFKSNYQSASKDTGVDLVSNPDQLNTTQIAAKASVAFIVRGVGIGVLNAFKTQQEANIAVTQAIGGRGLKLSSGIGSEFLSKVNKYSVLGTVKILPDGATETVAPIGKTNDDGSVSDGLTSQARNKIAKGSFGFRDPSGKYPLQDFLNEPDTNRLVRGNTEKTIFSVKKAKRKTGIENVGGGWNQPSPPYNAKYPYNRGYFSESGHGLEFDDTEGQERVSLFHKAGSFIEIDSFGNRVNKIVGSDYTIIEKNGYIYVDGTIRLTTGGNCNITVLGNCNLSVDGSMTTDVGGDYTLKVGGKTSINSGGDVEISNGGTLKTSTVGVVEMFTYEQFAVDAKIISHNAQIAQALELAVNGRDAQDVDHPEQLAESIEMAEMMKNDDMPPEEATEFMEAQVASGNFSKDDIEKAAKTEPTAKDEAVPSNKIAVIPGSCDAFLNKTDIPDDTMLSKYFSLASLTTKVALPSERNKIRPHMGLSVGQLVCNLKQLAENVLDPIKEQYPNIIITNAFRLNTNGSDHNLARSADIQFPGIAKSDYFEVAKWIRDNVLFDQLILEYTSKGSVWIHIGFRGEKNRRQVMTFMNHKKHSMGLVNLM